MAMDGLPGVQGVDVSWLHHSYKDHKSSRSSVHPAKSDPKSPTSPTVSRQSSKSPPPPSSSPPPQLLLPEQAHATTASSTAAVAPHRPRIVTRNSADKVTTALNGSKSKNYNRRNSWISSISQRFSSTPPPHSPVSDQDGHSDAKRSANASPRSDANTDPSRAASTPEKHNDEKKDIFGSRSSSSVKSSHTGFFTSAFKKFSSSGMGGLGRSASTGAINCQRKIMNVDPYRERCKVPDLDSTKLRRVAFCVDVEIAGSARYSSDSKESADAPSRKSNLSTSESAVEDKNDDKKQNVKIKDNNGSDDLKCEKQDAGENEKDSVAVATGQGLDKNSANEHQSQVDRDMEALRKKREKKKLHEGERKERRERRRRLAEANGQVPLELPWDSSSGTVTPTVPGTPLGPQDRPTTDPLRIYRRCCQLRETPILKRVVEEVKKPTSTLTESPGTVTCLDLSNYGIGLNDIITLGDWLAVVPVRKLKLDNCGLTDEAIRIVLSSLLSVKTSEQARHNKGLSKKKRAGEDELQDLSRGEEVSGEKLGVIEELSMKKNPKIGPEGWRYIALFLYMSRSLKAIDLSSIPFPPSPPPPSHGAGHLIRTMSGQHLPCLMDMFSKALGERLAGDHLEQLVMGECRLNTEAISKIADAVIKCRLKRLGLANNNIDQKGFDHIVRYVAAGRCEGLDVGGNNVGQYLSSLAEALTKESCLATLSLAECELEPSALCVLLPALVKLSNFRFLDLSHNRRLFSTQPNALSCLRRYLPRAPQLKRVHLNDVDLSSEHAIALAEIIPEVPNLAHMSILENRNLSALANAQDETSQEEAVALYASLMVAVRVSTTIMCIDIDVPSPESSEIIKALAKQMVAYSLRNVEQITLAETSVDLPSETLPLPREVETPEILLHLVGPDDGVDDYQPLPDDDYVIGGTGVVKALGICLGSASRHHSRPSSRDISPIHSGSVTPRNPSPSVVKGKAKEMSKDLLMSARKIRYRLRYALVREDNAGNEHNYRRLQFLDSTLKRIIQRFEDEYPETRIDAVMPSVPATDGVSERSSTENASVDSKKSDEMAALSPDLHTDVEGDSYFSHHRSRRSSDVSLASRALTTEEGEMHRLGQQIRRSVLQPELEGRLDGTVGPEEAAVHVAALRSKLENYSGDQIRNMIENSGSPDEALKQLSLTVDELQLWAKQDPVGFQKFKEAEIKSLLNTGVIKPSDISKSENVQDCINPSNSDECAIVESEDFVDDGQKSKNSGEATVPRTNDAFEPSSLEKK